MLFCLFIYSYSVKVDGSSFCWMKCPLVALHQCTNSGCILKHKQPQSFWHPLNIPRTFNERSTIWYIIQHNMHIRAIHIDFCFYVDPVGCQIHTFFLSLIYNTYIYVSSCMYKIICWFDIYTDQNCASFHAIRMIVWHLGDWKTQWNSKSITTHELFYEIGISIMRMLNLVCNLLRAWFGFI